MAEHTFNAYEVLELDPAQTGLEQAIACLDARLKAGARISTTAPQEIQARRDLLKINAKKIRTILEDDAERAAHARAYADLLDTRRRSALPLLEVLRVRGWYEPSDLTEIATLGQLPEEQVVHLLKQAGIPDKPAPVALANPLREATARHEADSIKCDLIPANVSSLYEFMGPGFGAASSEAAIRRWCNETDARLSKGGRGTPEHVRDSKLLGHIRTHLLNPDARRKYDNLLANSAITSLDGVIRIAGRENKVITREALKAILRAAKAHGVSEADATAYVEYWVDRTKGWTLQRAPGATPAEPLPLCGFCHAVAAPGQTRCRCGRELVMSCPACKRRNFSDRKACECGFPIGDLAIIEKELNHAKAELAADRLGPASAGARQLLVTWPSYAPATELLQQVSSRQKQLDAEHDAQQARIRQAEELAANRQFVAAAAILREVPAQGRGTIPADLARRVAQRVAESYALLEKGRAAERAGDISAAVVAMQAAATGCADLEEAKSALRRFPPPGVTRLSASVLPTCVRLQWEPAPGGELQYIVRRKEAGAPTSATDGEMIGQTIGNQLDDTNAAIGRAWHYAVVTVRSQVAHSRPVVAGPVIRPGAPVIRRAVAARGAARIDVVSPVGCDRIDVTRTPPGGAISRAGNEFVESGLKNGTTITYRFQAIYRNPAGGAPIKGEAVSVSLTPEEVPPPISNLKLQAAESTVRITWPTPRTGRAVLRSLDREPKDLSIGQELDVSQLAAIGQDVPIAGNGSTQIPLPSAGRLVVVPFTINGSVAVVGAWSSVNFIPEVANLSARPAGVGQIDLQWDWPPGVTTAVATIYSDAAAFVPIRSITIARPEYDRAGGVVQVEYGSAAPLAARVACVSSCGSFQSNGSTCALAFGRRGSVVYRIDNGATLRKRLARIMKTQPRSANPVLVVESRECDRIRDVVLVGLPGRLPLSVDDGEVVMEIPSIELTNGRAEVGLAAARLLRQPLYVKAFIRKPESQPQVRLQPAPKEQLLLKPG